MRLTLVLLGHTFDVSLEPTVAEVEDDPAGALNGGTTGAMPMGFVPYMPIPDDMSGLDRNNGWGDEGN